jgi:coenzyme F420-reducing hydrogenase beta subunit
MPQRSKSPVRTFGGYVKDESVRKESTSGGLFSALVDAWCDADTIVFGAESVGLEVRHSWVRYGDGISRFRKSKYLQSEIGDNYRVVKEFLSEGKKVLFSGTPCQIAGLKAFLGDRPNDNLLTVEVVCEGVPTPLYIKKFAEWLGEKFGSKVVEIDYRYKDGRRWDFEVMQASLQNPTSGTFKWKQDRWFNPFWLIWLQHLISRPSCYECPFATRERVADITLGDLWGVHLYCPDLYGKNGGASIVFCNSDKGCQVLEAARESLHGRDLPLETAIRYQGPMRNHIASNERRSECMEDIKTMPYKIFVKKWAKRPTLKLLVQKYLWGNRQKVWFWNLFH